MAGPKHRKASLKKVPTKGSLPKACTRRVKYSKQLYEVVSNKNILSTVFSHLKLKDLLTANLVCKIWYKTIKESIPTKEKFTLNSLRYRDLEKVPLNPMINELHIPINQLHGYIGDISPLLRRARHIVFIICLDPSYHCTVHKTELRSRARILEASSTSLPLLKSVKVIQMDPTFYHATRQLPTDDNHPYISLPSPKPSSSDLRLHVFFYRELLYHLTSYIIQDLAKRATKKILSEVVHCPSQMWSGDEWQDCENGVTDRLPENSCFGPHQDWTFSQKCNKIGRFYMRRHHLRVDFVKEISVFMPFLKELLIEIPAKPVHRVKCAVGWDILALTKTRFERVEKLCLLSVDESYYKNLRNVSFLFPKLKELHLGHPDGGFHVNHTLQIIELVNLELVTNNEVKEQKVIVQLKASVNKQSRILLFHKVAKDGKSAFSGRVSKTEFKIEDSPEIVQHINTISEKLRKKIQKWPCNVYTATIHHEEQPKKLINKKVICSLCTASSNAVYSLVIKYSPEPDVNQNTE